MKKIFKWGLIFFLISVVFIIATGTIITYFYKDEVIEFVVKEINKTLNTKVDVKKISFSVIRHFPNASLSFNNILIHSPKKFSNADFHNINTDTLLFSKNLSLDFNLIDIVKKRYRFRNIKIESGNFNLFITRKGENNLGIFKTESNDSSNIEIDLQKIVISNVQLQIRNAYKQLILLSKIKKVNVSGNFSENIFDFNTSGKIFIHNFTTDAINYISDKNIVVDAGFNYDGNKYKIRDGQILLENLSFKLSGNFVTEPKTKLDIKIKAQELSIEKILSLLPDKYASAIYDYNGNGYLQFNASISGITDYMNSPHIKASYRIHNGKLIYKPNDFALNQININGHFTNGKNNDAKTSFLRLDSISGSMEHTRFSGKLILENFLSPLFNIKFNILGNLSDIKQFFRIDTITYLDGAINGKIQVQGRFQDIKNISKQELVNIHSQGNITIHKGTIQFKQQKKNIKDINTTILFKNDLIQIDSLTMNLFDHSLIASGTFHHFLAYLFEENSSFTSRSTIKISLLDLKDFLSENTTTRTNRIFTSENFLSDITFLFDTIRYGKFQAYNIKANGTINTNQIHINHFFGNAIEGTIKGTAHLDISTNKKINVAVLFKNVDIREMFREFDNFNQDFIVDKNLKGKLTANINFSCNLKDSYKIIEESILSNAKIHITNGELIGFKPIQKLSKFVNIYELSHIVFSDLDNEIFIQKNKIILPQMHIKASGYDLDIAGEHTFNNEFSYHLRLLMSQILSKKARQAKQENSEFGIIEQDGSNKTSLYLKISGTPNDYHIGYDSEAVKKHINKRLKEEKENLKQILKEEFHWFSKDKKTKKNNPNNSNNSEFKFKFE